MNYYCAFATVHVPLLVSRNTIPRVQNILAFLYTAEISSCHPLGTMDPVDPADPPVAPSHDHLHRGNCGAGGVKHDHSGLLKKQDAVPTL